MSRTKKLRNGLFAAVTTGMLVFGAKQAFAAPSEASVRACTFTYCNTYCQDLGYSRGVCLTTGKCRCYHD